MSLQYLQQESSASHGEAVWQLEWTNKDEVVSGAADGGIRVWSPSNPSEPIHHFKENSLAVSSLSVSASGSRALACSLEGTVSLLDLDEKKVLAKQQTWKAKERSNVDGDEVAAWSSGIHPTAPLIAWSGRGANVIFQSLADDAFGQIEGSAETGKGKHGLDLKFSPDGKSVAVGTEVGHVVVIDVETRAIVATYPSHAMPVRSVSWSPDSQRLFSGSDDHRIVLHDVRAGSRGASGRGEGAVAILQGHSSWVLKVAASPDGRLLGSGGAEHAIKLWDVGQRACVSTSSSTADVWALAWQPLAANQTQVGKQFASGGDDKVVTWWKAAGSA